MSRKFIKQALKAISADEYFGNFVENEMNDEDMNDILHDDLVLLIPKMSKRGKFMSTFKQLQERSSEPPAKKRKLNVEHIHTISNNNTKLQNKSNENSNINNGINNLTNSLINIPKVKLEKPNNPINNINTNYNNQTSTHSNENRSNNINNKIKSERKYSNIPKLEEPNPITDRKKHKLYNIKLTFHSHRGDNSYNNYDNHPRNMLNSDDNYYYASANNKQFLKNENDWVRFMMPKNELYLPTKFTIKNRNSRTGVQTLSISIGDGNKKWISFECGGLKKINIKRNNYYQTFDINGVNYNKIKENMFRHIRVEFITNHGTSHARKSRFIVHEFQLHGITF